LKRKFGIIIALVMAISLCLSPVVVSAEDQPYETCGSCPTAITIDVIGDSVIWTLDVDVANASIGGNGKLCYALVISLDHIEPAFQIHSNDGIDATYAWGTHLYSPYIDGWLTGTTNTPVSDLDWVDATGAYLVVDNPDGIFTVAINKANLGPEFYWGVAIFGNTCDTRYPAEWVGWSGDASTYATFTIPQPPAPERDPDQFDMFVRFGYDSTRYAPGNQLSGSIEAAGEYNGTQYMLEIPAGCVIEGAAGRINWLWMSNIDGDVLSIAGGDATFSEPCTLYKNEGGRLWQDYWTGDWLGAGEWVEVGTFASIVDGEAVLE